MRWRAAKSSSIVPAHCSAAKCCVCECNWAASAVRRESTGHVMSPGSLSGRPHSPTIRALGEWQRLETPYASS